MDGIIIINKPQNSTSHDIVKKAKKILNEKVGHTGTLDPMATGVLPLLIGKGTLCSKYLINHDKIYEVELQLGIKTDTADSEGNIIERKEVTNLSFELVREILKEFLGKQQQMPPMYSAIKINGKKLYEYARQGKKVNIEPRNIEIYNIELKTINTETKTIFFNVHCSKGTYIRSLCEDIAEKLNTVGYMKKLKRIQVGDFNINNSITIDDLELNINDKSFVNNHFISVEELFTKCDRIDLNERKLELFLNGVMLTQKYKDGIYKIYNNENFIGIGIINNELLKRDIII